MLGLALGSAASPATKTVGITCHGSAGLFIAAATAVCVGMVEQARSAEAKAGAVVCEVRVSVAAM